MNCPHCAATTTRYPTFFCTHCRCAFNARTDTPFNYLEFPTDIVLLAVLWRLRYKLSLRDIAEVFLERGFLFTHEAIRDWETRFAPLIADQLRVKRRGQAEPPGMWTNLLESPWKMVLPLSSDRPRRQSGGFHVEREAEYGGG